MQNQLSNKMPLKIFNIWAEARQNQQIKMTCVHSED